MSEKHFCEIILNLDQQFKRLKIFSIFSSGGHFLHFSAWHLDNFG